MTAKEYLLRYRDAYREAQSIELKITQLRLKYGYPSAITYSDMPKAHNTERDLSDYIVKLDELTGHLVERYSKCVGIEGDILKRIDHMEVLEEREVLRLRYTYIDDKGRLMRWEDVAERMHVVRMTATRIHGRALQHFPMNDVHNVL